MSSQVLVIGIGNPDRGDDSVGLHVVRRLAASVPLGVQVVETAGDPLALMERWRDAGHVVLVDAAAPGRHPGRIHRFDAAGDGLPRAIGFRSTHAFGLADTVELARTLGRLPARMTIFAIEAGDVTPGAPLSDAVAASVEPTAARIAAELAHSGTEGNDA